MTVSGGLATNVFITFIARGVTTFSGVLLMVAAARLLGPQGKGEYAYLLTIIGLGTQLGGFGIGTANLYFASRDPASIGKLLLSSAGIAVGSGVLYFAVLALLLAAGVRLVPFGSADIGLIGGAVALGLLWMHAQNLLVGVGEVLRYNGLAIAYSLITLVGTVTVFWFLPGSTRAIVTVLLLSGGFVVASLWGHVRLGRGLRIAFDAELTAKMLRYGFTIYLSHAVAFLLLRVDLLFVQYYTDSYNLGLYSAALDFSQAIVQLQAVINMLLFPTLTASVTEEVRLGVTMRVLKKALLAYAALVLILAAGAEVLLETIFGAQFAPAAGPMVWVLAGAAALAIASVFQNHLGAAGRPRKMLAAPAVALLLQLPLCALLVPRYGIYGAAVSSCASFVLMSAVAAFKALRP